MVEITDPLTLPCGVVLPNRIAKAAMSEQLADRKHAPDHRLRELYCRWSKSGAGLLITGNVMIDPTAVSEPRQAVLDGEGHLAAFARWARAATDNGTQIWMQINHAGRQVPRYLRRRPSAPSAVRMSGGLGMYGTPRELSASEITDLIAGFATTARLAIRAGFTGIEIHAAHGYLISQFLSPLTNTRTDDWGGTPERRRRFLLAVVEAVRAAIGPHVPLAVKVNSADFERGGFSEDESLAALEALAALAQTHLDLVEISGGTFESGAMVGLAEPPTRASTRAREAYFLQFAERARERITTPLMLTGGFRSRAGMQAALDAGVDVIGLARPMVMAPEFPARLLDSTGARFDQSTAHGPRRGPAFLRAASDVMWHTEQIARLARRREPDPRLHPTASLARMLAGYGVWAVANRLSR